MTLARVTIYGTYGGQGHINVLHFLRSDCTLALFNSLGDKIDGFWIDTHRGNVDGNMTWQRVRVEDVAGTFTAYDWPVSRAGVLGPSAAYCQFVSACFLFHTAVAGRRGRGRTFQGGYGHTSQFTSGQWNSSTQTRLDNVADALEDYWIGGDVNVNGWELAVAPRSAGGDIDGILVTSISARSKVSTMVTRKIGRGL